MIDLYRITGQFPDVARTIERINNLLGGQAGQVAKDPNWLTGHPFEAEGSPFEAEGSPFEAEGSVGHWRIGPGRILYEAVGFPHDRAWLASVRW